MSVINDVENAVDKPWLTDASADIVAAYDNSICYTDSLMHCIRHKYRSVATGRQRAMEPRHHSLVVPRHYEIL